MMVEHYPETLKEALEIRGRDGSAVLHLGGIPELKRIAREGDILRIGAACTFGELSEERSIPRLLKEVLLQQPSGGGLFEEQNRGSDGMLALLAADSEIKLASRKSERLVPLVDFLAGEAKAAPGEAELLVEVRMDLYGLDSYSYRKSDGGDVSFVGVSTVQNGYVADFRAAFRAGGVLIRRRNLEVLLQGKKIQEAKQLRAQLLASYEEVLPAACMELLKGFLDSKGL